jgi:hypothetical protein
VCVTRVPARRGGTGERTQHRPQTCRDGECQRYPCRMYREGFRAGYSAGHAAGKAEGHAEGYADGYAEGAASASGSR